MHLKAPLGKMLILFPFVFLSTIFGGVQSEVQLEESGGDVKRPADSIHLSCRASGFTFGSYWMSWVKKSPGKGLEWVGEINPDSASITYLDKFKGRFIISRDNSNSLLYLQMNNLKPEDMAVYYCARRGVGNWYFDVWGPGTLVTVTSASPAAPSLFPLIAPSESESNGKVAIGCLAKNFLPDSITFSWNNKNNDSNSGIMSRTFPSILGTNTYTASSQALVPSADWMNKDPFYCKASHPSGNPVIKVIRGCDLPSPVDPPQPEMSVRAPPIEAFFGSYLNATITCRVVNLPSNKYTLQWLKKGQVLDSGFTTIGPEKEGRGYSIRSELIVTKTDWISDISFSCAVNGKDFNDTLKINRQSFCQADPFCNDDVRVETIPPSYADIFQTSSAKLTCRIANVPIEQDLSALNVTWTKESDRTQLTTVLGKPEEQANGLTYIDATATVCATDWNNYGTFTCKVNFPGLLPKPIDKTLEKRKYGTRYSPAVYVLPPTSEELALRETATVTCLVKGFSPEDIFLQWLHNDHPVNPANFYTSEPKEEPKAPGKYFIYSILYINESDWSHGDRYTCMVGHEMIPMNSTQKTIDKNTGKPTVVNVSLVLSDTANTCN